MGPANASIGAGHNNVLPGESQGPHLRRVRVIDARFDRFRTLKVQRRFDGQGRVEAGHCGYADCLPLAPRPAGPLTLRPPAGFPSPKSR